ncbi:ATP-binding protein [Streptomyces lucensis JCM 4490]|uniref:ATP-binding protein n=1 Tax=Streptomyces lucensis JCM 4490 TaxID=1306176 RepID=A0A918MJN6_9ACTN|nr:ATP-binding protein [Streptomyces lucensis]GGW32465.1 ATP-binding protein [Streptomyces lucensis JCM 4490]
MSLPLTRRIARAALLVAAGAAAGVGAAGSAGAANLPASTPNVGGLTALDGAHVGNTVDGAAQSTTSLAGDAGSRVVDQAVPAAGKAGGGAVKKATPAAQKAARDTAGTAGGVLADTASGASRGGLPTDTLSKGRLANGGLAKGVARGGLTKGLPTSSLPTKGVQLGG